MTIISQLDILTQKLTTDSKGKPLRLGSKTETETHIYARTGYMSASQNPFLLVLHALSPDDSIIHTSVSHTPTKGSDAVRIIEHIAQSIWNYDRRQNSKKFASDLTQCIESLETAIEEHKGGLFSQYYSDKITFIENAKELIVALRKLRRDFKANPDVVGQRLRDDLAKHRRDALGPPAPHVGHGWPHPSPEESGYFGGAGPGYPAAPYPYGGASPAPHFRYGYPHGMHPDQAPTAPATPYDKYPDGASDGSHSGWTPGPGSGYDGSTPPGSEHGEWPDHSRRGPGRR